jgi:hypothetical protein
MGLFLSRLAFLFSLASMQARWESAMNPSPVISETAYYRQTLTRKRAVLLRCSVCVMTSCAVLQALWLLIGAMLPLPGILTLDQFLLLSPWVFLLLLGSFALLGLSAFRRARQPVSMAEVSHLRQAERERLFRQALGVLPAAYRPWRLALETLLGLSCAAGGIACLLFSIPHAGPLKFLYAGCLQTTALYLLYTALYTKPRRARQLPAVSARELRRRLALGEETGEAGGQDMPKAV